MRYFEVELVNKKYRRGRPAWILVRANYELEAFMIAKERCAMTRTGFETSGQIKEISHEDYNRAIERLTQ